MNAFNVYTRALALSLPMTFMQSASAQSGLVVDNLANARMVENYLVQNCSSYRSDDVQECVQTNLELTLGIANAFEQYVRENMPYYNISRRIDANCQDNFNAIVALTPPAALQQNPYRTLPVFVRNGFLGARQCLFTIESIGQQIGVNYMPSSRALLHDMIDNADQGRLTFRYGV